ncbi:MAG: phage major capsid protein [Alkalilacustris sp.]
MRLVAITRQVLINDDLDAFTRIPAMYGNSIAQLESDVVWGIITPNPAMAQLCRAATKLLGSKYPARKTHGYCAKSWFRTGLDEVRRRLRSNGSPPMIEGKLVIPRRLRLGVV